MKHSAAEASRFRTKAGRSRRSIENPTPTPVVLAATHNFVVAIIMALTWLLLVELFSTQQWLARQAEQLSLRYEAQFLRAAQTLKPVLQLLSDNRLLGGVDSAGFYSKEELLSEVERDNQVLNKDEKLLIRQALSYQDVLVRDIMVPLPRPMVF